MGRRRICNRREKLYGHGFPPEVFPEVPDTRLVPEVGTTKSKFLYVNSSSHIEWKGINQVPSGGTTGQVLTKTADGEEWADPSGGGSVKYYDCKSDIDGITGLETGKTVYQNLLSKMNEGYTVVYYYGTAPAAFKYLLGVPYTFNASLQAIIFGENGNKVLNNSGYLASNT